MSLPALKKAINPRPCVDCNVSVTHYLWSPLWCPDCDKARIERIDRSFAAIAKRFGIEYPVQGPEALHPRAPEARG